MKRLTPGQALSLESREGQVFGRKIKINRKTVVMQLEDNRQWGKVSAGMNKLLQNVELSGHP